MMGCVLLPLMVGLVLYAFASQNWVLLAILLLAWLMMPTKRQRDRERFDAW